MSERTRTGSLLPLFADTTAVVRALAEDGGPCHQVDFSAAPSALFAGSPLQ
ncbi:hypothetical protein [Streptomyces chrestomyceticus]|uniref:hypothetical protein n=1 Tax=Streptomyces chrestomyceticus TaxID=68185 RepID=UPI0035A81D22